MQTERYTTFILFGGTGDLAKRKIFPALLNLYNKKLLPQQFKIIGFSRKDLSDEDYRKFVKNVVDENKLDQDFLNKISYFQGDINDKESYESLKKYIQREDDEIGMCSNKIIYLAVPPYLYEPTFLNLEEANLVLPCVKHEEGTWTRVLVEKPFGSDFENAKRLDKMLGELFEEEQIFRIDHYLAKEALQNIIFFRFANPIFLPIWNSKYIEKIEIKLYEKDDVEDRISFYNTLGALRDVGQNHILQMLALVGMDDPEQLTAESVRKARAKALSRVVPFSKKPEEFSFRAQYEGYGKDIKSSKTETYFKLKLNIKNDKLKGIPIYLESGKALDKNLVLITVTFKEISSSVCPVNSLCDYGNEIKFQIQPEEKIDLKFWAKKPGLSLAPEEKKLSFGYSDGYPLNDAYEKVFFDCIVGDQTLFTSTEEVLAQWGIIKKVREAWLSLPLHKYKKGERAESVCKII